MRQKGLVKLLVNLKFCEETFIRSKRGPIISRNTKLLPFNSSCQNESNELCFIFLQSLDAEIFTKYDFLSFGEKWCF